ncbi:MAG: copper-containing nitrite reductase [Ardenticatenaceae bacterium]|nr:copper-containing nitrite reductase [Ardenticatenaceae bacterium]
MKRYSQFLFPALIILALVLAACGPNVAPITPVPAASSHSGTTSGPLVAGIAATAPVAGTPQAETAAPGDPMAGHQMPMQNGQATAPEPDVTFTLQTAMGEKGLGFVGVGGDIDGVRNPTLKVAKGAVVQIVLIDGDGMEHDLTVPDFNAHTDRVRAKDDKSMLTFRADREGQFAYFCSVPGHRQAGMEGQIVVGEAQTTEAQGADIVRNPTDLPPPVGNREPQTVRVDLEAVEVEGQLAEGTTYSYWTFNGKVPGPLIRVRVGDTVEVHLKNPKTSTMVHSIDLHAVTGPGGGALYSQVPPGEEKVFTFKALIPGLFVYHCATPMVAHHIANGMYGMILVEPEGGLPAVDREFYVMQGEIYTQGHLGDKGHQEFSEEKLLDETPTYLVFNGAAVALTGDAHALHAKTGETVRIFFGVGGPNKTSSFHVIGEIFDRVYNLASLTAEPLTDVQTITVPPGGAAVVDFKLNVPGRYILVDHALSRLDRGLVGFLYAEGPEAPEIFHEGAVND